MNMNSWERNPTCLQCGEENEYWIEQEHEPLMKSGDESDFTCWNCKNIYRVEMGLDPIFRVVDKEKKNERT